MLPKNQEYQKPHFYYGDYQIINVNDFFCFLGLAFLRKKRKRLVVY